MDNVSNQSSGIFKSSLDALSSVSNELVKVNNGHYNIISKVDSLSRIIMFAGQIIGISKGVNTWFQSRKVEKLDSLKEDSSTTIQPSSQRKDVYEGMSFAEKLSLIRSLGNETRPSISPAQEEINKLAAELSKSRATCDYLEGIREHLERDKQDLDFKCKILENKDKASSISYQI